MSIKKKRNICNPFREIANLMKVLEKNHPHKKKHKHFPSTPPISRHGREKDLMNLFVFSVLPQKGFDQFQNMELISFDRLWTISYFCA
jgi:hypothetical protein